jgi:hypothetical protein
VIRDRRIRFLLIVTGACLAGNALIAFYAPHYSGPVAVGIIAIVLQGMRHLRASQFDGKPTGLFLVRALVVVAVMTVPFELREVRTSPAPGSWQSVGAARRSTLAELRSLPDRQLVLVRYHPDHDPLAEWVYNDADIDNSKTVWARDMGPDQNEELLRYYPDRHAWLLEADETPPKLSPYPCGASREAIVAANQTRGPGEHLCR